MRRPTHRFEHQGAHPGSRVRAAVFRASGDLRIEDAPAPDAPGTGEVTLEVSHAAVCGTDSAEWDHGPVLTVPPVILGHEFAGRVVAVGSGVAGIGVGDRVASGAGISCAECEWCRAGRTNLCSSYHTLGLQVDGGLAELVNAPVSTLLPIPDGVTDAEGALAQPLAVAIHAVKRSGVAPGQRCVVIGVGGIGAFIVAAAASRGVEDVIAVDVDNHRLRTAALLGASQTVDASHGDLADVIRTNTGPDGPDVVIEASGAPSAPAAALASVRRGGRVMLVGLQSAPPRTGSPCPHRARDRARIDVGTRARRRSRRLFGGSPDDRHLRHRRGEADPARETGG